MARLRLRYCEYCKRVDFMHHAGKFFWRCSECGTLQAKELS